VLEIKKKEIQLKKGRGEIMKMGGRRIFSFGDVATYFSPRIEK